MHSRFSNSMHYGPSSMGGNTGRISAYEANKIANAPPASLLHSTLHRKPRPALQRNPITGEGARPLPPRSLRASGSESSLHGGFKPILFPPRGTINSIGSTDSLHGSPSSSFLGRPSPKARRLEYEVWLEAQRRSALERELKQVIIHGRSRPPWIGDARSSGYRDLMPQTR